MCVKMPEISGQGIQNHRSLFTYAVKGLCKADELIPKAGLCKAMLDDKVPFCTSSASSLCFSSQVNLHTHSSG